MHIDKMGEACVICNTPISVGDVSYSWVLNKEAYNEGQICVNESEAFFSPAYHVKTAIKLTIGYNKGS